MPHTSAASSRLNWRQPADLNGLANAVGSQYPSHYLGTWCIQAYYRWCRTPLLPAVDWTDAYRPILMDSSVSHERRNLVSARVPSHFKRSLPTGADFCNWYSTTKAKFWKFLFWVTNYKICNFCSSNFLNTKRICRDRSLSVCSSLLECKNCKIIHWTKFCM